MLVRKVYIVTLLAPYRLNSCLKLHDIWIRLKYGSFKGYDFLKKICVTSQQKAATYWTL